MIGAVVESVGLQALLQDGGRHGHRAIGVPTGGPADPLAHEQANALVGQGPLGALEVLLGGIRLRAVRELVLAATGAPCTVRLDGAPAPFAEPFGVHTGQVVELGPAEHGLRTYLAVAGGFTADAVLGSVSCDPRAGLGPEPFVAGDTLEVGDPVGPVAWGVTIASRLPVGQVTVAATWGPRADWFTAAARAAFASATWEVTGDADRVGVRLGGPVLARAQAGELRSEGVVPGSVQVPPNGQPIVFGPDSPTTGGYPVIAVVDAADLGLLGQARPGTLVTFDVATLDLG